MTVSGIKKKKPEFRGSNIFIARDSFVLGDVKIYENVSVWFGAVLRGDIEEIRIDQDSNIQDSCVLHTDFGYPVRIGRGVTVGHSAVLHGCTIKDNCLIGIGATLLNGAVIGENSIIGAGTLITEGTVIPEGSCVVGLPGKIRRKVTQDEIKHTKENSRLYVESIREYKAQGLGHSI